MLEEKLDIDSITVMVQKEVAERLTTIPGKKETGSIRYAIYYYCEPKLLFDVPNTSFIPVPEVTSSVINLKILKVPRVKVNDEKLLFKIIKAAFMQKRKTLVNALVNNKIFNSKTDCEKCLNDLNIDTKVRGEKLTLEDFAKISDYLK